jgi:hypothetical protein
VYAGAPAGSEASDSESTKRNVGGRRESRSARDGDELLGILVHAADVAVHGVEPIELDADRADERAVLVERQPARIGGQAQRRALRSHGAVGQVAVHVGTGQLRELHAIERP